MIWFGSLHLAEPLLFIFSSHHLLTTKLLVTGGGTFVYFQSLTFIFFIYVCSKFKWSYLSFLKLSKILHKISFIVLEDPCKMTQKNVFDFDGLLSFNDSTVFELENHRFPWEDDLQQYENDTSDEAARSGGKKKRKCQSVSGTKAAATLPENHQYFPDNNQKQKMKKEREDKLPEHIETKTVLKVTKILKDRVLRRTKNVKFI